MEYYLGIDIGTTLIKAALSDSTGKTRGLASAPYQSIDNSSQYSEQDAREWWESLGKVVRDVIKELPPDQIKALSCSTQGGTIIPVDKKGEPVHKAILWTDSRAGEQANQIKNNLGGDYIYFRNGKKINATSPIAKLLWIKQNEQELYDKTYKLLQVPDYINYQLTGNFIIDTSNASYNAYFMPESQQWDEHILSKVGINKNKLPQIIHTGKVIGNLTSKAADFLGLSSNIKVVAGAHDQACAAYGAGLKEKQLLLSMGTAWVLYGLLSKPVFHTDQLYTLCCYVSPRQWSYFTAMKGSIIADWFINNFCKEDINIANQKNQSVYDYLLAEKYHQKNNIIFLPHFFGSDNNTKGGVVGLSLDTEKSDILLAILESLAFEVRKNIEFLHKSGLAFDKIKVTGGPSKNQNLNQILANVINLPVQIMDFQQAPVEGAAALAFTGSTGQNKIRKISSKSVVYPDKHYFNQYSQKYQKYKSLCKII
jgi:xylulokinase